MKYQIIKIEVQTSGQIAKFYADTNKLYKHITGIFFSVPNQNSLFGSTISLKIADEEIFPDDFEAKMITCSEDVTPNERFYKLKTDAEGNIIEGRFTDGGVTTGVQFPYTAKLYLRLEDKIS